MLAIIIPYFKLTFFEATLQSLANQTDKRFKVYIGDDASPENPKALLEKYQGQFNVVYHRFQENLGGTSLTQQWERCIALSRNETWLMILGDDDVLSENVVEKFYENVESIQAISKVIRFATQKINHNQDVVSDIYLNPKIEIATDFLFRHTRSSLSEYMFCTERIKTIGFKDFPLGWFSDVLAVLEFSNFKEVNSINDALVYIRISPISISGKKDNLNLKAIATFEFYYYLLSQKSNYFTKNQNKLLFQKIENCYLNNKNEIILLIKITKIYFLNLLILDYIKFLKSIFLSVLNRTQKNERRR